MFTDMELWNGAAKMKQSLNSGICGNFSICVLRDPSRLLLFHHMRIFQHSRPVTRINDLQWQNADERERNTSCSR